MFMVQANCTVILFDSTHQAMSGEMVLKHAGIKHAVISTPREFSVSCGISLRIAPELEEKARHALDEGGVVWVGMEPYRSRWI